MQFNGKVKFDPHYPNPPNRCPPNLAWRPRPRPLCKILSRSDKGFSLPAPAAPPQRVDSDSAGHLLGCVKYSNMELPATRIYRSCRGHVTYFSNVMILNHLLKPCWSWSWVELVLVLFLKKSLIYIAANNYYLPHSYSMEHGADYKTGLRLSVCSSVRNLTVALVIFDRFSTKIGTNVKNPKRKNEFVRGQHAVSVCITSLISNS